MTLQAADVDADDVDSHPADSVEEKLPIASADVTQPPLGLCRQLLFGLAAPPLQMTGNIVGFFFSLFLLEVVHMSPLLVSVITFTGRAWDAITDPLVGQLVFRTSTRFGRTRPWLLTAAVTGSVSFTFMWTYGSVLQSEWAKFVYYFILYLLYCTLITCYHVPYTSSTILLSRSSKDKDGATACRMTCELVFTIVGCGLFGVVISSKRIAGGCGSDANSTRNFTVENVTVGNVTEEMVMEERNAYLLGAGIISLIFFACGLVATFGIREQVAPEVQRESLLRNVKSVMTFRPYLLLMFAFLFMSLAIQIVQVNLALYVTHSINMTWHTNFAILNVLGVAAICIPIWYLLAMRFGKKVIFFVGLAPLIPCLAFAVFMPKQSAGWLYLVTTVAGVSISVAMLLPWSMLPDVIDDFYCKRGERKEATFYSLYVFFTKFAAGISLAFSQLTLAVSRYDSHACRQSETVGWALRILVGPAPIVCICLSLALIWKYPIDKNYRIKLNGMLLDYSQSASPMSSSESKSTPSANGNQEQPPTELCSEETLLQELKSSDSLLPKSGAAISI